jgi:predicted outer membrane protein
MRLLCCALALAAFAPAFAADEPKLKFGKDDYLPNALANALSLERFCNLAATKSEDPKVKKFAEDLSADAKACREKFVAIIKDSKTGVVAGMEKGRQAALAKLALRTGAEFDRDYLDQVISDLKDAAKWNKMGRDETHAKLKEIATKQSKSCEKWLARAEELKKLKFGTEKKD